MPPSRPLLRPADWQRASALLDGLLDQTREARTSTLAALDVHEPAVAALLRRLLAADDDSATDGVAGTNAGATTRDAALPPSASAFGTLLDAALAAAPDAPPAAAPGQRFGHWQVSKRIGTGGMGEVWLARRADGQDDGLAAVKLLKTGTDSARLLRRFARERRVLARLDHPGIARLLDAGVEGTRPYLVLEHVEGQALPDHLATARPDLAGRVRLAVQIGAAVAYAHGQLIVHRDLKPSNVMVMTDGTVKLLDFGIAGLLDDAASDDDTDGHTALTQLYGRGLTLDYAAPEQITGEPTGVACDVFSLGVLTFEMLTGVRPFGAKGANRKALEHAVLHQEAPRLSRVPAGADGRSAAATKDLRGDLEAVVAKALRKRPEDRYPTMAAFVADLGRWLAHRPVSAGRGDRRYRARLWLRRNRLVAALALTVVLSLLAGLGIALWQLQRARAAEARALVAAAEAAKQTEYADLRRDFAMGLLEAGDVAVAGPNGASDLSLQMLDTAEKRLSASFEGNPLLRGEMRMQLALNYLNRSLYDRALGQYRDALRLFRSARADAFSMVSALDGVGLVQYLLGDVAAAEQSYREAAAFDPAASERKGSKNPHYETSLHFANLLNDQERWADSEALLDRLLRYRRATATIAPGAVDETVLDIQNIMADTLLGLERPEAAVRLARETQATYARSRQPLAHITAEYLQVEGLALLDAGRPADAARRLADSHALYAGAFGREHRLCGTLLAEQGAATLADGRVQEAEALLREVLRVRLANPGTITYIARRGLARSAIARGDAREAVAQARLAWDDFLHDLKPAERVTGPMRELLGEAALANGDLAEAESQLRRAVSSAQALHAAPSIAIGRSERLLAEVLGRQGRHPESVALASDAVDQLRRKMGERYGLTAQALTTLARAQLRSGQLDAALVSARTAVAATHTAFRAGHPELAEALTVQGEALRALDRGAEALPRLREASATFAATPGLDPVRVKVAAALLQGAGP